MQQSKAEGFTAAQLVQVASDAGYAVTRDEVTGWHQAGLLPRPVQLNRRPGEGRGTFSEYPLIAAEQLQCLLKLREENVRYETIGWGLWWRGYEVDSRYVLDRLFQGADQLEGMRAALKAAHDAPEPEEAAADAAVEASMVALRGMHHPPPTHQAEFHHALYGSLLGVGQPPPAEDLAYFTPILPLPPRPDALDDGARRLKLFHSLMVDTDFRVLIETASPEAVEHVRETIVAMVSAVGMRPSRSPGRRPESDRNFFQDPYHPWMVLFMLALHQKGATADILDAFFGDSGTPA